MNSIEELKSGKSVTATVVSSERVDATGFQSVTVNIDGEIFSDLHHFTPQQPGSQVRVNLEVIGNLETIKMV